MMKIIAKSIIASFLVLFSSLLIASNNLNIEITQGVEAAWPIAVVDFKSTTKFNPDEDIANIVRKDLAMSGQFSPLDSSRFSQQPVTLKQVNFNYFKSLRAESLVVGEIKQTDIDMFEINFELIDVFHQKGAYHQPKNSEVLVGRKFTNVPKNQLRSLAHHISDLIYTELTEVKGAFSTRIAYVVVNYSKAGNKYKLDIADMDGFNAQTLFESNQPIMSPTWSPDGKKLAFVSFEKNRAQIYEIELASGNRKLLSSFAGINGAPNYSPDGEKLAFVLSKDGAPKIYMLEIAKRKLHKMTSGVSIDTEPRFMPDGKNIVFTSNRGGKPQIYQLNTKNKKVTRLTYLGDYNARPAVTPDNKHLVMIHKTVDGKYNIALQKLGTDELRLLSRTNLDESPSIAPNGSMILYGTKQGDKGVLGAVSIDGSVHMRLPVPGGDVQEPAWSPFLS